MRSLPAKPACRVPANPPSDLPLMVWFQQLVASFCGCRFLSTDGASKKMRIDLTDPLDVGRNLRAPQARPQKSALPLLCSQEAGVRAKFRIGFDVTKTVQDLEHQFRIDRLIFIRSDTFPDYQPAISSHGAARFI